LNSNDVIPFPDSFATSFVPDYLRSKIEIRLPSAEWASIVKNSLEVDGELKNSPITRVFASDGSTFVATFSCPDLKALRTSLTSFNNMLSLAVKTLNEFGDSSN